MIKWTKRISFKRGAEELIRGKVQERDRELRVDGGIRDEVRRGCLPQ